MEIVKFAIVFVSTFLFMEFMAWFSHKYIMHGSLRNRDEMFSAQLVHGIFGSPHIFEDERAMMTFIQPCSSRASAPPRSAGSADRPKIRLFHLFVPV